MGHQIFFFSVTFITLVVFSSGTGREVTVKIYERALLACPAFSDPENVTDVGWYRCSSDDCEHDWDKFKIAYVENMTEAIPSNPNYEVYINGTLVIKKVLPVDDGKIFICMAKEKLVRNEMSTTILHIDEGVKREFTLKINQSFKLDCLAFSDPENVTSIGWHRCSSDDCEHDWDKFKIAHVQNRNETIADNPNFEVNTDGTLFIKEVQPVDDGKMFICSAMEKHVGIKRSTTILHIAKEPPKLIPECPRLLHVIKGMDLHMDATVQGYPYPWVAWTHNELLEQNDSFVHKETRFKVRNVILYDSGRYTCYAENPLGNNSFTVDVYVQENSCTPTQGLPTSRVLGMQTSPNSPTSDIQTTSPSPTSDIQTAPSSPTSDIQTAPSSPTSDIQTPPSSPTSDIQTAPSSPTSVIYVATLFLPSDIQTAPSSPTSDIETTVTLSSSTSDIQTPPSSPTSETQSPFASLSSRKEVHWLAFVGFIFVTLIMFCFNTIITDPAERFEGRTVIDYPVGNDGSGDDSQHAPEQNKTIESKEGGRAEPQ